VPPSLFLQRSPNLFHVSIFLRDLREHNPFIFIIERLSSSADSNEFLGLIRASSHSLCAFLLLSARPNLVLYYFPMSSAQACQVNPPWGPNFYNQRGLHLGSLPFHSSSFLVPPSTIQKSSRKNLERPQLPPQTVEMGVPFWERIPMSEDCPMLTYTSYRSKSPSDVHQD